MVDLLQLLFWTETLAPLGRSLEPPLCDYSTLVFRARLAKHF